MSDTLSSAPENEKTSRAASETPYEFSFLNSRFHQKVKSFEIFRGDLAIKLHPSIIVDALKALLEECDPSYNYLSYIAADHWIERDPPVFEINYGLQANPSPGRRLRIVCEIPDTDKPSIKSVTSVHPGANYHEREAYDLSGIIFEGHPNLKRLMTPETYTEHPLRRDFPHAGEGLSEFQDRLIAQWNVAEEREYVGKFGDPWINRQQESTSGHISLKRLGEKAAPGKDFEPPGDQAYRDTHREEK